MSKEAKKYFKGLNHPSVLDYDEAFTDYEIDCISKDCQEWADQQTASIQSELDEARKELEEKNTQIKELNNLLDECLKRNL